MPASPPTNGRNRPGTTASPRSADRSDDRPGWPPATVGDETGGMSEARQLRVALAQVDTRVGDISGNSELVLEWTRTAADDGAHLVVFPEMTLTGYPAEDLVLRESFARASEEAVPDVARRLAEQGLGETVVVLGYLAHTEG